MWSRVVCLLLLTLWIAQLPAEASSYFNVTGSPTPASASVVDVSDLTSLKTALNDTTVKFIRITPPNSHLLLGGTALTVASGREVTILGNGAVFDAEMQSRVFKVGAESQFTVRDASIINGNSTDNTGLTDSQFGGGCVVVEGVDTLTNPTALAFDNVTFDTCIAVGMDNGGALAYWFSFESTLSITRSTFKNCVAAGGSGGAIYTKEAYGAPGGKFDLFNNVFQGNTAGDFGGALCFDNVGSITTVEGTVFRNNVADASCGGGAVAVRQGPLTVINSTFIGNNATSGSLPCGAAISLLQLVAKLELDNDHSTFIQNEGLDGWVNYTATNEIIHAGDPDSQLSLWFPPSPTASPTFKPTSSPLPRRTPPPPPPDPKTTLGLIVAVSVGASCLALVGTAIIMCYACKAREDSEFGGESGVGEHNNFVMRRNRQGGAGQPKAMLVQPIEVIASADWDHKERDPCFCMEDFPSPGDVTRAVNTRSAQIALLTQPEVMRDLRFTLPCGHVFHAACLIKWCEVEDKDYCPVCRARVAARERRRNRQSRSGWSRSSSQGSSAMGQAIQSVSSGIGYVVTSARNFVGGGGSDRRLNSNSNAALSPTAVAAGGGPEGVVQEGRTSLSNNNNNNNRASSSKHRKERENTKDTSGSRRSSHEPTSMTHGGVGNAAVNPAAALAHAAGNSFSGVSITPAAMPRMPASRNSGANTNNARNNNNNSGNNVGVTHPRSQMSGVTSSQSPAAVSKLVAAATGDNEPDLA